MLTIRGAAASAAGNTTAVIGGVQYEVVQYTTCEQHTTAQRPNLAAHMQKAGIVASAILRRQKGHKHYMANHYGGARWRVLVTR